MSSKIAANQKGTLGSGPAQQKVGGSAKINKMLKTTALASNIAASGGGGSGAITFGGGDSPKQFASGKISQASKKDKAKNKVGGDGGAYIDSVQVSPSTESPNPAALANNQGSDPQTQQKLQERIESAKLYSETQRLQAALFLNSTLEDKQANQMFAEEEEEASNEGDTSNNRQYHSSQFQHQFNQNGRRGDHYGDIDDDDDNRVDNFGSYLSKRVYAKLKNLVVSRLFKLNYVLLDYQAVNHAIYHVFLLFEFLQMLYYAFYKFEFTDEFMKKSQPSSTSESHNLNLTTDGNLTEHLNGTVTIPQTHSVSSILTATLFGSDFSKETSFRIDQYLLFANFHLYPLQSHSTSGFILVYAILIGVFYSFVSLLFFWARSLFKAAKNDEIKDSTQAIVKGLSLLMAGFLFVFQIPMVGTLLQGFLCDEQSESEEFILKDVTCGSLQSYTLTAISAITLTLYLLFLYVQLTLYSSANLENSIPWASLDNSICLVQVLWKLIMSFTFFFDKEGQFKQYTRLVLFFLGTFICAKRLMFSVQLDRKVAVAATSYDIVITWVFLHVSAHEFSNQAITINKIGYLITGGIFFAFSLIYIAERYRNLFILKEKPSSEYAYAQSPMQASYMIYRWLRLIGEGSYKDKVILQGMITYHYESCNLEGCGCEQIFGNFGIISQINKLQLQPEDIERLERKAALMKLINQANEDHKANLQLLDDTLSQDDGDDHNPQIMNRSINQSRDHSQRMNESFNKKLKLDESLHQSHIDVSQLSISPHAGENVLTGVGDEMAISRNNTNNLSVINEEKEVKENGEKSGPHRESIKRFKQRNELNVTHVSMQSHSKLANVGRKEHQSAIDEFEFLGPKQRDIQGDKKSNSGSLMTKQSKASQSQVTFNVQLPPELQAKIDRKTAIEEEEASEMGISSQGIYHSTVIKRAQNVRDIENVDDVTLAKEEMFMHFRFLSFYVDRVVIQFPKSFDLRIHSSNLHCFHLDNEFKATFELMKCEQELTMTLQTRFILFRQRLLIEKNLFKRNQTIIKEVDIINSFQIYNFEKLYQRFIRNSYLGANAALNFWRELLKKNSIDSQILLEKGSEISKIYAQIKDIAKDIQRISPNDIKFLLQYSTFLWEIVHISHEAQHFFDLAFQIYQRLPSNDHMYSSSQVAGGTLGGGNGGFFGENPAVGVIICALSAEEVGRIVHCSDEVKRALGYKRRDLINKNIKAILPNPIAIVHDRFLTNFLETAKSQMLNQARELFAMTKDGYLRPVKIMLQLYPQLQEKITIMGFIQSIEKLDGIIPPKSVDIPEEIFYQHPHHYLLTDKCGNVVCISEGLKEIGLNSKFFELSNSKFKSLNIESLFGVDITAPDIQSLLINEGIITRIDTSNILEQVNIESISQEETLRAMSRQGIYNVHLQIRRYIFDAQFSVVDLYRIVLLPRNFDQNGIPNSNIDIKHGTGSSGAGAGIFMKTSNRGNDPNMVNSNSGHGQLDQSKAHLQHQMVQSNSGKDSESKFDLSSQRSSSSGSRSSSKVSYSTVIQEFKSAIGQREMPPHLVKLNIVLFMLISITVVLSGIDYSLKLQYVSNEKAITDMLVHSEIRTGRFVQLCQTIRSLIDVANGLEYNEYDDIELKRVDRFEYLRQLVIQQQLDIYDIITYFSQQRSNYDSDKINQFEGEVIPVYMISPNGQFVEVQMQHYKLAFDSFLNKIVNLNVTSKESLQLPEKVFKGNPYNSASTGKVTNEQRDIAFLLMNGLRMIQHRTHELEDKIHELVAELSQTHDVLTFQLMMIAGIAVCLATLAVLVFKLLNIDKSNKEILSIFSLLNTNEIVKIYNTCDTFIDRLDDNQEEIMQQEMTENGGNENYALIEKQSMDNTFGNQQKKANAYRKHKALKPIPEEAQFIDDNLGMQQQDLAIPTNSNLLHAQNNGMPQVEHSLMQAMPLTLFEESKEESSNPFNKSSDIVLSDGRRIRDPASDSMEKMKLIVGVRKEYYSAMIQKTLNIIKEHEKSIEDENRETAAYMMFQNEHYGNDSNMEKQFEQMLTIQALAKKGDQQIDTSFWRNNQRLMTKLMNQHNISKLQQSRKGIAEKKQKQEEVDKNNSSPSKQKKKNRKRKLEKAMGVNYNSSQNDSSRRALHSSASSKHSKKTDEDDDEDVGQSESRDSEDFDAEISERQSSERERQTKDLNFNQDLLKEMSEFENRRNMIRSISPERIRITWRRILLTTAFISIFIGYFIYTFVFHKSQLNVLYDIQILQSPFIQRFEAVSLSYQYVREKLINQKTKDQELSFTLPPALEKHYADNPSAKPGIGQVYHELSMEEENEINKLKGLNQEILQPLLEFANKLDQGQFCATLFDNSQAIIDEEQLVSSSSKITNAQLQQIVAAQYLIEILEIMPACEAAQSGDLAKLRSLRDQGANLTMQDYDLRTPLHYAANQNQIAAAQFLLDWGIPINVKDRWGATALSYGYQYPEMRQLLTNYTGQIGTKLNKTRRPVVSVQNDQYRLFFAAFYDDVEMLDILKRVGWKVNVQDNFGRTALSIASAQGNLEAVKFLISFGADFSIKDSYGNDAFDDALNTKLSSISDYLVDNALLKKTCPTYEQGVFENGFSQAINFFNRKFADLEIQLMTLTPSELPTLLTGKRTSQTTNSSEAQGGNSSSSQETVSSSSTHNVMQIFFQMQELFMYKLLSKQQEAVLDTFNQYSDSYLLTAELVFYIFLAIQLFALFQLRFRFIKQLKNEVMNSRGILNLVPERFFRENQGNIERVIKMIAT